MEFNPDGDLDSSQVEDVRGSGGGRLPGGRMGLPVGGGVGGLILLIIIVLLNGGVGGLTGSGGDQPTAQNTGSDSLSNCKKVSDIQRNQNCRFVAYQTSIQDFWTAELARHGKRYQKSRMQVFSGQTSTGCGPASSSVGPFYCPVDKKVYIDVDFLEVLFDQLGAEGGMFAEAYVIAHEYGHHVQDLYGYLDRIRTREGPESDSVRSELQADCLAGVWANHATTTPQASGKPLISNITQDDIQQGLDAAAKVGDDYIQSKTQGQADPESFTHGTSAQRQHWFDNGYKTGDLSSCDTWGAQQL
ncbi:MAG TPA: neutral zinc metallopeptidase [Kribbellaceae bacterium]|nr:neutral zinc metallopeptidase [Kribbellaceae bacterium]